MLMDRGFRYRLVIILINYPHELVLGRIQLKLEWWKMHVIVTELEDTAKANYSLVPVCKVNARTVSGAMGINYSTFLVAHLIVVVYN